MKARIYWSYVTRSLVRGGQRTLLAIFCIAVGVMAIVALQLAGQMVGNSLTGNVRQANGGDVSIRQDLPVFQQADATYVAGLQQQGRVVAQTGETDDRAILRVGVRTYPGSVAVIDPAQYPLVGQPDFTQPAHADLHTILAAPNDAVLSANAANSLHVSLGDQVAVNGTAGRSVTVRIVGLVGGGGLFSNGADVYVRRSTYQRTATAPLTYNVFYMTTSSDAQASSVAADLKKRYPLATVQTVADALKADQQQTQQIHQLLQVVGILALLIGGFGVVNTMNVMLARRRIEIAMLKTTGYRRRDLYVLFGLEAALLGFLGGVVGAAIGVALSVGVKTLLENAFELTLSFAIDPGSIVMGILVGLCTAVIFGLQPIVRAAAIRPQAVLRDADEPEPAGKRLERIRRRAGTIVLFLLLSVLFCVLASIILGDPVWGIAVVYGTFVTLGVLSIVFSLLVWLVSALPVPERFGGRQAILSTIGLLVALAISIVLPSIGIILVLVALLGYAIAFLPKPLKATVKMALRNMGRQRGRSTMTLLALFVGVFSVGLMVILGQDIRDKIDNAIASQSDYNAVSIVPAQWSSEIKNQLGSLPGLKKYKAINAADAVPIAINGQPIVQAIAAGKTKHVNGSLGQEGALSFLSGLGGYDLAHGQSIGATIPLHDGRPLTAADAGTTNVLVNALLHTLKPLVLQVGDRIMLANPQQKTTLVVTIAGFYNTGFANTTFFEPILASSTLVHTFAGLQEQDIYSLSIDPKSIDTAVAQLNKNAAHAQTLSLASLGTIVDQILGNLITLLVALAALALFAGIIIIANAVGLAMLERRREQGILKSVGYTSSRVLSGVLIENGVIGGLGGLLGMVVVAIATTVLARSFFKTTLDVPGVTTIALIALVTAIALVTSALVAWGAVRVRPLEVLRYE